MPEHRPPVAPHDSHRRQGVCSHLQTDRSEQQTRETAGAPRADYEHVRIGALLAQRAGRRVANQQRWCSHGRIACLSAPHAQIEDFSGVLARRIDRANPLERHRRVCSIRLRRCVSTCPGVADSQRKAPQPSLAYGPVEGLRAARGSVVADNNPTSAPRHHKPLSASQQFLADVAPARSIFSSDFPDVAKKEQRLVVGIRCQCSTMNLLPAMRLRHPPEMPKLAPGGGR
jgi:hypothetical protein